MVLRLSSAAALAALFMLLAGPARAQVSGVVSGRVTERGTGLPVIGATVVIEGTNFGTAADADGNYRFSVTEGRYLLRFTALGYETVRDSVAVRRRETTSLSVSMRVVGIEGEGAVVERQGEQGVGVSPIDPRLARDTPL